MKKQGLLTDPQTYYTSLPRKHLSACILLPVGDRYLIIRKSTTGSWGLPGGVVAENESPEQTAARECFEEINLRAQVDRLLHVYYSMPFESNGNKRGDSIHFVFLGQPLATAQLDFIRFSDGEVDRYLLVTAAELHQYIQENLGQALEHGLHGRLYANLQRTLAVFQKEEQRYQDLSIQPPAQI